MPEFVALGVLTAPSVGGEYEAHVRNWMPRSVVPCEEALRLANRGTVVGQELPFLADTQLTSDAILPLLCATTWTIPART